MFPQSSASGVPGRNSTTAKFFLFEDASSCLMAFGVTCLLVTSLFRSMRFITLNTGRSARSVEERKGIPPKPLPTKFISKNGKATLLATKIAARLEKQRGSTEDGSAVHSKIVMAIAKHRVTPAQNAAAPTIPNRAMKEEYIKRRSSGLSSVMPKMRSANQAGINNTKQRPIKPPIIMVGATTPVGMAIANVKTVVHHFMKRQSSIVDIGVRAISKNRQLSSCSIRCLSKSSDMIFGWGLPLNIGSDAAQKVFRIVMAAQIARSLHWN
mmetsp:Transcript_99293/g.172369  ORF Transcript_99293/g.172369 Transcript_99293/m.172369 type:complete len:268 (-) Transcript_99293:1353-2156(-)